MAEKPQGFGGVQQLGFTKTFFNFLMIVALLAGLYGIYTALQAEKVGKATTGRVVRTEKYPDPDYDPNDSGDGFLYAPVVEFSVNGTPVTFESAKQTYPPAYNDGEQVRVRYDPAQPQSAEIDDWTERWVFPLVVVPLMLVSLLLLNFYKRG